MAVGGEDEEIGLAENLADPPVAMASGADVGQVEGLIWSDATGVNIVSVEVRGDRVAVPVEGESWRHARIVHFDLSAAELHGAPRVQDLEAGGGTAAVEAVSRYFSMPLDGPPPGPSTGPLPPWWDKPKSEGSKPDDGPAPVVG